MKQFNRILNNQSFSVRFQRMKDDWEPRTADFVLNENDKKEFFKDVDELGLVVIYSDNDVWHINSGVDPTDEKFTLQMALLSMMYYKYKFLGEIFKSARKIYLKAS